MEQVFDYKALLQKYIQHVGQIEGTAFLGVKYFDSSLFSAEEWIELNDLCDTIKW